MFSSHQSISSKTIYHKTIEKTRLNSREEISSTCFAELGNEKEFCFDDIGIDEVDGDLGLSNLEDHLKPQDEGQEFDLPEESDTLQQSDDLVGTIDNESSHSSCEEYSVESDEGKSSLIVKLCNPDQCTYNNKNNSSPSAVLASALEISCNVSCCTGCKNNKTIISNINGTTVNNNNIYVDKEKTANTTCCNCQQSILSNKVRQLKQQQKQDQLLRRKGQEESKESKKLSSQLEVREQPVIQPEERETCNGRDLNELVPLDIKVNHKNKFELQEKEKQQYEETVALQLKAVAIFNNGNNNFSINNKYNNITSIDSINTNHTQQPPPSYHYSHPPPASIIGHFTSSTTTTSFNSPPQHHQGSCPHHQRIQPSGTSDIPCCGSQPAPPSSSCPAHHHHQFHQESTPQSSELSISLSTAPVHLPPPNVPPPTTPFPSKLLVSVNYNNNGYYTTNNHDVTAVNNNNNNVIGYNNPRFGISTTASPTNGSAYNTNGFTCCCTNTNRKSIYNNSNSNNVNKNSLPHFYVPPPTATTTAISTYSDANNYHNSPVSSKPSLVTPVNTYSPPPPAFSHHIAPPPPSYSTTSQPPPPPPPPSHHNYHHPYSGEHHDLSGVECSHHLFATGLSEASSIG